ncbi:MAG: ATP-binding protein, partial [Myxococcota bacterium]
DFSQDDVGALYAQHTQETGQVFDKGVIERVFELTQGQPWLVNALAYDVCFRSKGGQDRSNSITVSDIDTAKEQLIQRRETHLDQLMAKLKQERVQRVLQPFLLGENCPVSVEDAEYVADLGLLKRAINGELLFSNPIYQEIIPRALSAAMQQGITPKRSAYVDQEGRLCMNWLITEFQQFFRENSDSWLEGFQYKEAGPHLILQAFLQRIINGGGTIHREYALGRGRTDLLVTWPYYVATAQEARTDNLSKQQRMQSQRTQSQCTQYQRVVLELKLLHEKDGFDRKLQEGIEQTTQYMDRCTATEGHLLLFDRRAGKSWDERIWVRHEKSPDSKAVTVWGL